MERPGGHPGGGDSNPGGRTGARLSITRADLSRGLIVVDPAK